MFSRNTLVVSQIGFHFLSLLRQIWMNGKHWTDFIKSPIPKQYAKWNAPKWNASKPGSQLAHVCHCDIGSESTFIDCNQSLSHQIGQYTLYRSRRRRTGFNLRNTRTFRMMNDIWYYTLTHRERDCHHSTSTPHQSCMSGCMYVWVWLVWLWKSDKFFSKLFVGSICHQNKSSHTLNNNNNNAKYVLASGLCLRCLYDGMLNYVRWTQHFHTKGITTWNFRKFSIFFAFHLNWFIVSIFQIERSLFLRRSLVDDDDEVVDNNTGDDRYTIYIVGGGGDDDDNPIMIMQTHIQVNSW